MTDLGDISHYLGMKVNHVMGERISLCQSIYLKKILDRFEMTLCKPASIPMDLGVSNFLLPYDRNTDKEIIKWYHSAIRPLIWMAVNTCPDIAFLVGLLSQYCSNRGYRDCNLVIQIFRYLSRTVDLGITFTADSEDELIGYSDSDDAGLIEGQKSTGGYIFILSGRPLSHQSELQSSVTLSSIEAKYMAATEAGKGTLWVAQFLTCLGFHFPSQFVDLRVDNK